MNTAGRMLVVFKIALGGWELVRNTTRLAQVPFVCHDPVLNSILAILIAMFRNLKDQFFPFRVIGWRDNCLIDPRVQHLGFDAYAHDGFGAGGADCVHRFVERLPVVLVVSRVKVEILLQEHMDGLRVKLGDLVHTITDHRLVA